MNGDIAHLIASDAPTDMQQVRAVFGANFQNMGQWRGFLRAQLNDNVTAMLSAPAERWSVRSFQALYIACWIHHPVEKGAFMISLGHLPANQRNVIQSAYEAHCYSRKSSHLSGSGRSASEGWAFLNGYDELLVQYELTKGQPYLYLKTEGHTTGLSGIIPHMASWVHKRKHGVGKEASPALNALAHPVSAWSGVVEARAAENYAKGYEKMLKKVLGLSGKQVTTREMMKALFQQANFPTPPNFDTVLTNQQLGNLLEQYCNQASTVGAFGLNHRVGGQITGDMIRDLRTLARSLIDDGDVHMHRVYREIRAEPVALDLSLANFYEAPG